MTGPLSPRYAHKKKNHKDYFSGGTVFVYEGDRYLKIGDTAFDLDQPIKITGKQPSYKLSFLGVEDTRSFPSKAEASDYIKSGLGKISCILLDGELSPDNISAVKRLVEILAECP